MTGQRQVRRRRFRRPPAPIAVVAAISWLALAGCDGEPEVQAGDAPPPAVTVIAVSEEDVTSALSFTGRIEAVDTVDLRARVQGFLEHRLVDEGATVDQDQTIFVIEKAPFQAAVDAAKGSLDRAQAELTRASKDRERYEVLVNKGDVSRQQFDQAVAQELAAKAEVTVAEADLEKARLDLSYTDIVSPIAGRIGRAQYSVGNLVGPDSGVLATIVSQNPMYVTFPVSQRLVLAYQKQKRARGEGESMVVRVILGDGTEYAEPGRIDFADIQVSESTDTLTLRADVPNPDGLLIPGQFVDVSLQSEEPKQALVIPQAAVQIDQAGLYVLIVDDEDKVALRRIETEDGGEDGHLVVKSGLKAGETVIVEGAQKVRPGQVVEPTVASATAATG